jgi:hypothetical protein
VSRTGLRRGDGARTDPPAKNQHRRGLAGTGGFERQAAGTMNQIVCIVGAVVIVPAALSFVGPG